MAALSSALCFVIVLLFWGIVFFSVCYIFLLLLFFLFCFLSAASSDFRGQPCAPGEKDSSAKKKKKKKKSP